MKPINVGLLGLGHGRFRHHRSAASATAKKSRAAPDAKFASAHATARDLTKPRDFSLDGIELLADADALVTHPDIDIVCELIGGDTTTKDLVLKAIANGKHVVTANKALLAKHGTEIFAARMNNGVMVAFEAAVAGGVPIIKALREGLDGQSHRVDRRHHQRHFQLHPLGDALRAARVSTPC